MAGKINKWNKSDREHQIIGTSPGDTKTAADQAVKELNREKPCFIDADHININNLAIAKEIYKQFLPGSDELCGPYAAVIDIDKEKTASILFSKIF